MKWNLLIVTLISLLVSSQSFAGKTRTFLSGYDDIVSTDGKVTLVVKLEEDKLIPYRPDVSNAKVSFFAGNKILGEARTNHQGKAYLRVKNPGLGTHIFMAHFGGRYGLADSTANMTITVAKENTPILISDIDHTISDASATEVVILPYRLIRQLPGANKILKDLELDYQIVYLTARDDTFILKTKKWLDYLNFPKAPVYFWDFGSTDGVPSDHGDYKSSVIKKLKNSFSNILVGVGDKPHDIRAYLENDLKAFYIGKEERDTIPSEAIIVDSWDEIQEQL